MVEIYVKETGQALGTVQIPPVADSAGAHNSSAAPSVAHPDYVSVQLVGGVPIMDAVFIARPNQFIVEARLATGENIRAHCADRGRLHWLVPGTPLLVGSKAGAKRKTAFQVAAAWTENAWASLDTHLPNRLIEAALLADALPQFHGYHPIKREARYGHSRFDFRLGDESQPCYVEVKSVGTAHDGLALFPDAPTQRGARHLAELAALAANGIRTALVFVAQHAHAAAVMPDRRIDPQFADALLAAAHVGVEIYAYRCPISRGGIRLEQVIPCVLA